MPLHGRPQLQIGGIGTHGQIRREFYRLPQSWCLHAYRYEADLRVDGLDLAIRPGSAGVIQPDVEIEVLFHHSSSVHAYVHYWFGEPSPLVPVMAMQSLGLRFESFAAELEQVITLLQSNRTRAEVKLWDLLWELADRHAALPSSPTHPAVNRVLERIELRLAGPLRVGELADQSGLSHNHLTRLFRQQTGLTLVEYIRKRRIERAHQLLVGSNRQIKSIAMEVGIPDLQHFNKLIRRELRQSPRELRRTGKA